MVVVCIECVLPCIECAGVFIPPGLLFAADLVVQCAELPLRSDHRSLYMLWELSLENRIAGVRLVLLFARWFIILPLSEGIFGLSQGFWITTKIIPRGYT